MTLSLFHLAEVQEESGTINSYYIICLQGLMDSLGLFLIFCFITLKVRLHAVTVWHILD